MKISKLGTKLLTLMLVIVLAVGCLSAAALADEENTEETPAVSEPEPAPETPSAPETPEAPSEPETPSETETPSAPEQSAEPSNPQETASPEESSTPGSTEAPSATETPAAAGPDERQSAVPEDDDDSTPIYSGNPNVYYDFSDVSGFDYTDIPALARALDSIFAGHVNIYTNALHTVEVPAELGSFTVPNNDVLQYVGAYGDGSRSMIGTSCWIYGNGFYFTLFRDYVGNGDAYNAYYSERLYISDVSYSGFKAAGVRQQPGAYLRLGERHTVCILNYDETSVTIIDGNGDGVGGIAIRCYTWNDFALRVASFGGVSHAVQAQDWYFSSLYPTTAASGDCGESARWYLDENGLLTIVGEGEIDPEEYADYADDIISVTIDDGITVIPRAAFKNFSNLEQIDIADSVESIGYNAFDGTEIEDDILVEVFDAVQTIGSREEDYSHDYVRLSVAESGAPEYEALFVTERHVDTHPVKIYEDVVDEAAVFAQNLRLAVQLAPVELNEDVLLPAEYAWSAQ